MLIKENYREIIVTDLIRTILGPRYGLNEVFHEKMNPWKLYLTGILAPRKVDPDDEGNNELDPSIISSKEDINMEIVDDPDEYVPNLDSNSQPRSMGISFIVKTSTIPKIDLCFTWARYIFYNDWKEVPKEYDENNKLIGYGIEESDEDNREPTDQFNGDIDLSEYSKSKKMDIGSKKSKIPKGGWKRSPRYLLLKNVELNSSKPNIDLYSIDLIDKKNNYFFDSSKSNFSEENFLIHFRCKKLYINSATHSFYKISIFFVNNDEFDYDRRFMDFIFQPQIRVNCVKGTSIEPYEIFSYENESLEDTEENSLRFLYQDKRPRGKGHMCSVIWKEIDPEKEYIVKKSNLKEDINEKVPEYWEQISDNWFKRKVQSKFPPFYWVDGQQLNQDERDKFTVPDIRSEYIPVYPINAPIFDWRRVSSDGANRISQKIDAEIIKFLDPEYLAENCWQEAELENCFNELLTEYQKWIDFLEKQVENEISKNPTKKWAEKIARSNIEKNHTIIERIKKGLKILIKNFDARLAFCFANKVIHEQNTWKSSKKFYWRPFQIAFLLLSISSIVDKNGPERAIVDLIWFPTGGGKTEAYLLLAAFAFAYRRRISIQKRHSNISEAGTVLISRYTLRLLTIQQFRRALSMILACEILRVTNLNSKLNNGTIGWLPESLDEILKNKEYQDKYPELSELTGWIWGTTRFSVGLWVGGALAPNRLQTISRAPPIYGALDALKVKISTSYGEDNVLQQTGDPAQILKCPICKNILSFPKMENYRLPQEPFSFHLMVKKENSSIANLKNEMKKYLNSRHQSHYFEIKLHGIFKQINDVYILKIEILPNKIASVNVESIVSWWRELKNNIDGLKLGAVDIRNPGYFYLKNENCNFDFEIRCCNPACTLNQYNWAEKVSIPNNIQWTPIPVIWRLKTNQKISRGIPINAYTVDEQIYRKLPTIIIGTVDKFAQLAFKDDAGAFFGNVEFFNPEIGFFKERTEQMFCNKSLNAKRGIRLKGPINPPEIILQDELHLIEGPLGSMFGIYETMIDEFCKKYNNQGKIIQIPKYIASTATIRAGKEQVQSLFVRELKIFPAPGISERDSFFLYYNENNHPLEESVAGRLYIGICCPGKSAQAPLSHIWGSLFQSSFILKKVIDQITAFEERYQKLKELDRFWTVVGYFNAMRELAGVRAIYNQEFISWMRLIYGEGNYRNISDRDDEPLELSSRTDSTQLPNYLDKLDIGIDKNETNTINGVLTTSMFGTGVDVTRLGVMVINGQPKTTGSYIQASGRIGRSGGGIIVTFYRAGRPRDLDHYEQFLSYHQAIHKYVEPTTVVPFAPECVKIAIGPLFVGLCRQGYKMLSEKIDIKWRHNVKGPRNIQSLNPTPSDSSFINAFLKIIDTRFINQPEQRKPNLSEIIDWFKRSCDQWRYFIDQDINFLYNEYTLNKSAENSVILGDAAHQIISKRNPEMRIIFENAPNSLRGIEATTTFGKSPRGYRSYNHRGRQPRAPKKASPKKRIEPIRGS